MANLKEDYEASLEAKEVSEAELLEQRVSFAFGNAPKSERITKDSVRRASKRIRLRPLAT